MRKNRSAWKKFLSRLGLDPSRKQKPAQPLRSRWLRLEPLEERRLLTVGPVAHPIPDVNISQGSSTVAVPLTNDFQEIGGAQSALRYQVVADSNRSLFLSPPVVARTSMLFLQPAPNALGSATLTVCATDANGLTAEGTIVVNVSASEPDPSTDTAGLGQDRSDSDEGLGQGPYITTLAGNGNQGYSGDYGAAADAEINCPVTFALDAAGNLFFCDAGSDTVREVDQATGQITTVAGDGVAGHFGDRGPATAAELDGPQGVAVNPAGTELFIADTNNNVIREVDLTTGTINTIAGDYAAGGGYNYDGPATDTQLNSPHGIALDASGNLIISDSGNNLIRELDLSGPDSTVTTIAGNYNGGAGGDADGSAASALFSNPTDVAIDNSGNIFVADYFNNAVREITGLGTDPQVTTIAGNGGQVYNGDNQPPKKASLYYPEGVAVDDADDLLIADSGNCRIREVTGLAGGNPNITTIAGDGVWNSSGDGGLAADAELDGPGGVGVNPTGNYVYIAESSASRVRRSHEQPGGDQRRAGKPRSGRDGGDTGRQRGGRRRGDDLLRLDRDRRQREPGGDQRSARLHLHAGRGRIVHGAVGGHGGRRSQRARHGHHRRRRQRYSRRR